MTLTERYVYAVTTCLPQSQRAEVAKELRASIEDMAAGRAKNGKPTQKDIEHVLKELGDPKILAHNYHTTGNYLIGPKWFGAYTALLKQLLYIVPGIVAAALLAVQFAQNEASLITIIVQAVGTAISVAVHLAFWVTLIFAIFERVKSVSPEDFTDEDGKKAAWTPDQLPFPPQARQISRVDAVSGMVLTLIGVGWVALSPILHDRDGEQLFNPNLWVFWIPLFFVLVGLSLVHKLFQLKIGNWTTPLVVTNLLLGVAGIAYVLTLVTTTQIVNPGFLHTLPPHTDMSVAQLQEGIRWTTGASVAGYIGLTVWEMAYSIMQNRRLRK